MTQTLLSSADIEIEKIKPMVLNYMRTTLDNINAKNTPKEALTGPIQRGDVQLIQEHIKSLEENDYLALYKKLALYTMSMIDIENSDKLKIRKILEDS